MHIPGILKYCVKSLEHLNKISISETILTFHM